MQSQGEPPLYYGTMAHHPDGRCSGGLLACQPCRILPAHHDVSGVTITPAIRERMEMNNLDQKIMAAERDLDAFAHGGFTSPWAELLQTPADKMHALLVERADELMGCTEGSPEEAELATLTDAIEAYEAVRWPDGKEPGGKG
jgi:hypothetical protein